MHKHMANQRCQTLRGDLQITAGTTQAYATTYKDGFPTARSNGSSLLHEQKCFAAVITLRVLNTHIVSSYSN